MQAVGGAVGSSERLFLLQLSTAWNPLSIRQSPGLPSGEMSLLLGAFALEQGAYSRPYNHRSPSFRPAAVGRPERSEGKKQPPRVGMGRPYALKNKNKES